MYLLPRHSAGASSIPHYTCVANVMREIATTFIDNSRGYAAAGYPYPRPLTHNEAEGLILSLRQPINAAKWQKVGCNL